MDPQSDTSPSLTNPPVDLALSTDSLSLPSMEDLEHVAAPVDLEEPDDPALKYLPAQHKARAKGLSLGTRATVLAIVVGMLPLMGIGSAAYYAANRALTQQTLKVQGDRVAGAATEVSQFLQGQAMALQLLATTPTLTTPRLLLLTPIPIKQSLLTRYLQVNRAYDSLALVSADGQARVLAQAGREAIASTLSQNPAYREVLKTGRSTVTLEPVPNRPAPSLFLMTPVKNETNGQTIAVLRGRLVTAALEASLQKYGEQGSHYYLIGPEGRIFATSESNALNQAAPSYFSNYAQLKANPQTTVQPGVIVPEKSQQVIGYSPVPSTKDLSQLPWDMVVTADKANSLLSQQQLQAVLGGGAILSILVMGALAALLAGRVTRPILVAAKVVESLGQGDLDSRIEVEGNDEIATLGANINLMADQIQALLKEQTVEAERIRLLSNLTLRIREVLQPEIIVETAVQEIQQALGFDRVAVYSFEPRVGIQVVAEALGPRGRSILGTQLTDVALIDFYQSSLEFGTTSIVPDIYQEGLSEACIKILHSLAVWAELVAPIQVGSQVFGLLVAHQCSEPYTWQTAEVSIFSQLATQIGLALDQASLLDQLDKARQQAEISSREQQEQKERLQMQLVELLTNIEEASRGDLTVRADVTVGEIGTVADFFNAIIESLRQIVTQVKKAAAQVNVSIGQNEGAIRQLADEALLQAEEITRTLDSVEQMAHSVQAVADNARRAAEVARDASHTAEVGGAAMDRTVESILNLRETVAETAKKVKRLGESSQQISRVVSIINQIALQTNLLAINASIEAARAGEEGRGFAVVAEEVGQLAAQSAAATREIEQIVETIQRETGEVVSAMELGTTQVVEGTRLVEAAKTSLGQILEVSREIDRLVQSISSATVSQAQTSETVAMVMKAIAQVSERTSHSSRQVSSALQETVTVARQLQDSVGVFKVGV